MIVGAVMKKLVLVGEVVELPLKVEVVAEEAAVEAEDAAHQTQGFMYLPLDPKKRKIRKTKTKMTEWRRWKMEDGRQKTEDGVMERWIRYEKKKRTWP